MTDVSGDGRLPRPPGGAHCHLACLIVAVLALIVAATSVSAQAYRFTNLVIEGNRRVAGETIITNAGIARGEELSAGDLDDAYQAVVESGLFERVTFRPEGRTLTIEVVERPTLNRITFEGNSRIPDADLSRLVSSQPRRVYSPKTAEADAERITQAYAEQGRLTATVTPQIIERADNRVDLVFEITEGRVISIERLSFVGNAAFSDRRLGQVLETKQAGLLRTFFRNDTFIGDRLEFDKQLLSDFYSARGYIDFRVQSVSTELTRARDAFLITFNIREGQQFRVGDVSVTSDLAEVDTEAFRQALDLRSGVVYSPDLIDRDIARLERLALEERLDFISVEPQLTRNDRELTLDIEFRVQRGPRVFVERIDIKGNATTLDRVIRRQFTTAEGDPFNPRAIRAAADRIRSLGFFADVQVEAREGTSPDKRIIEVTVEEQPTGSLSFGASFSVSDGPGANIEFSESNFLGRGQSLSFSFNVGTDTSRSSFSFREPAFLGRDVAFAFSASYFEAIENNDRLFNSTTANITPSLQFPVGDNSRLSLRYSIEQEDLSDYEGDSNIIARDVALGETIASKVGYTYSYDTRGTGLDPTAGIVFRFSQDFAGLGGDRDYVETTALLGGQRKIRNESVTLTAEVEGGLLAMIDGDSRITERYFLDSKIRGFEPDGIGPRDNGEALGGNSFAVARLEAEFPLGLPEDVGLTGGVFADVGTVWGLDDTDGGAVDDGFILRSALGVSLIWRSAIGPLRFNFSQAVLKESFDETQNFDLTVATNF